jgi:hypothetical protein
VPWSTVTAWEAAVVAVILVVASVARFWDVAGLPAGLQADEATGGILAWQMQRDGRDDQDHRYDGGLPGGDG